MRVVFRFDANEQLGHGHLMRSSVLARALIAQGHQVDLLSRPLPPVLRPHLDGVRCHPMASDTQGLDTLAQLAMHQTVDWLVVDHYGLDSDWESQARAHVRRILVIDDLANRAHDCDALLDQNIPNSLQSAYGPLLPQGCPQWLGLTHLLARPGFYEQQPVPRQGLLVFLGGGDHRLALGRLLQRLATDGTDSLQVLATSAYGSLAALAPSPAVTDGLEFHLDVNDTAPLCRRVAGAVVRCGFMAYELALVGTPMVIIHATPIQQEVALALQALGHGMALAEADMDDAQMLAQALERMRRLQPAPLNLSHRPGAQRVTRLMEDFQ